MSKPNFRKLRIDIDEIHRRLAENHGISAEDLAFLKRQREEHENAVNGQPSTQGTDYKAALQGLRFSHASPPADPVPLYSLAGHTIATAENIMMIQAKIKAGKSAAIGAMIASTMEPDPSGDCLWFASANPDRHAVVHFDTEQSKWDHYQLITRSVRRAGKSGPPPWLYSYHIKGHSIDVMRKLMATALEVAAQETGGVHSCIIDGIGDLCPDVNDAAESNALVAELEGYAMLYRTLIACVLHENHGSDSGKTRGHLGSQLARKAETNLRLEKDAEGITVMFADTSRSVHISKKQAPGFRWDDERRCHVSVETSIASMQANTMRKQLEELTKECFKNSGGVGLTYCQLRAEIIVLVGCSERTAERTIRELTKSFCVYKKGESYHQK